MGKYFKYAIGEILLVVIGILIALQINNWNEHRKLVQQENEILKSLKSELQTKSNQLTTSIKYNTTYGQKTKELFDLIRNDTVKNLNERDIIYCLSYYPYQSEMPVLNEILKSENKLVSKKDIVNDLRNLNTSSKRVDKNLFYVDELYNSRVTDFILQLGLELTYTAAMDDEIVITKDYITQNGYNKKQFLALMNTIHILREDFANSQKTMLKLIIELQATLNND